ncbi:MAG: selenide, water dikinase SelD [Pseudomonadota bacterium]
MTPTAPYTHEIALIGGGHTHALVLKSLGMRPIPGARLTVINPGPTAPYTGMLPGFVAGHYSRDDLDIDIVRLCRFAGARLLLDKATGLDRDAKRITLASGRTIPYDIASIDVGITSAMPDIPGFAEHAIAAKPLERFADAWESFRNSNGPKHITMIGGGVAGIELTLAMHHALTTGPNAGLEKPFFRIIEQNQLYNPRSPWGPPVLATRLAAANVEILDHQSVAKITASEVHLSDGTTRPSDLTIGAAGARPWPWLADLGLAHTDGYLDVDDTLRSTADPTIYAAGDCAHLTASPRPKAGVYAVRAAPILAHNLRADLTRSARRRFTPQKDFLKLISLGGKDALVDKWGVTLASPHLWHLKDWIDRRFMDGLSNLTPMGGDTQPPCAGCGAKVGPAALAAALDSLPAPTRSDVTRLAHDDAALLGDIVATTDHLRAFTDDPYLFARITALHAMGDVWAMGAAPQAALATIILPHMDDRLQADWLAEITAGAASAFTEAGADIAGGHTTLGAELTVGFTVTGTLSGPPITLSGAQPGDQLILTRPLGSGTLLAADMALKAPGAANTALLAEMSLSQGPAAAILHGANAMTDVTGFGLAGHLMNILRASNLSAYLNLSDIPLLDGALARAESGTRSTLFPANRQATPISAPDGARTDLLFDPQTAGGLLASLPKEAASKALTKLTDAGYKAAIIGDLTDGPAEITAA